MLKLIIFGAIIPVKELDLSETGNVGHYDPNTKEIAVEKSLTKYKKQLVLIHEIVHATFHRTGLKNTSINSDMEEVIADSIATAISENFELKLRK